MRALDRLALYSTCAATAVIIASAALLLPQAQPRLFGRGEERSREQAVVQAVDWARVHPELRRAVEVARGKGVDHALAELERLHAEMMLKVDTGLLDWYFRYWTQQRLGLNYAFTSGKTWLASAFVEVDAQEAAKDLQTEIGKQFELRVIPGAVLDQHLQRIAQESVGVFIRSLEGHLQEIPKQYQIPAAEWDDYLNRIAVMVQETEGSRSIPLTLKAVSTGVVLSGAGATAALAPYVTARVAQGTAVAGAGRASGVLTQSVARRAASTFARQAAGRGLAAGAGSWSGALTGGLALAALVAWEIWDHRTTVAENRPLLRDNIDRSLRLYERSLIEPQGMIGSILHDLERQIAAGLPA